MRAEEEKTFIDIPFSWNEKSSFEEVQSYLNFLEKIDGTEKYYRSYYECLRKRHIISSTLSNLQSEDKEKIGLHWLRICYATDDKRANFFFLTHPDPSLDREEEIRKILFPPNGKGNLDNFFSEKPEGKAYLQPLLEWFRHRYDLDTANRIQKHINKIQRNLERPDQSSFGFSVAALVLISFFTVLFVILYYASGSTPWTPEIWDVSFGPPLSQVWIIPFLWGSVLLLYLGSIFVAWRKRHLIIPKLIGGISAGYLFLLSSDSL
ncbi:MAG: hypothetical protein M1587_04090, partial [Thaumarchaeota archaeon]|nr:hypothetical protein [Nitrososphaerota archaeon]